MKFTHVLLFAFIATTSNLYAQTKLATVASPDKKIEVTAWLGSEGKPLYSVSYGGESVLKPSKLGLICDDGDFSASLQLVSVSAVKKVTDNYRMINAKRERCVYNANKKEIRFRNAAKQLMDIIFQVSNDGIAFRYYFPGQSSSHIKTITEELTSFHFPAAATAWLQPMQVSKTGWEATNPAYEEHYRQNITVGTTSPSTAGWVYPALFRSDSTWMLITESSLDTTWCGTRLQAESPNGEYAIGFPDPREIMTGKNLLPRSRLPFYSPWRIIAIGSLATIAESTLGTDLAKPSITINTSFVKPGKSSWSWIMSKDDSIVYSEQKRYIDYTADMNWQYCLVDVNWDQKIGYDKMKELASYAISKNAGLLAWYNSAGDWNTVKYTPKGKLLTHTDRVKEFARLKQMGIKGVKIDFFAGDGQSVIKYYIDILNDAAAAGLLVNFHGATLPRGWNRTYPHLMTTEAVRGFEMITFSQDDANKEATHCAILPFTRNAFDPMDFTPMNLHKITTRVVRKTTSAFELATSVLFLSGIQHFAESPEGMSHMPGYVKQFLKDLPVRWEDVKFIDGFPGKYVVIARRAGNKWYIAGINAEETTKTIELDPGLFKKRKGTFITDAADNSFIMERWQLNSVGKKQISLKPNGGFVLVLE